MEWSNWSGNVTCAPRRIELPSSEEEIRALVRRATADGLSVRVVGTGHSFTPIVATDGVLLSLDNWKGVTAHDTAAGWATARSGTKLHDLGAELLELGLAMENLGDVDVQSLGGAIGTGTHGTGPSLGNIPTQIARMRLVTADGGVVECSADEQPELFRAARVSLGMLGVTSTVTLRLRPAYRLHERVWSLPIEECMERLERPIAANTRFEFFWYPGTDEAECKTLNDSEREPDMAAIGDGERVGWSAQIIPSVRTRKFNEMEYSLPAAAGPECFRQVRARMRERHADVLWPVEYRTLAPDDAWLSTAYGRPTVTISIHQAAQKPYDEFFFDIESIFRAFDGRPHWGKIHSVPAAELRDLYPMWDAFTALRAALDPRGRFLNHYLRGLFA